MGILDKEVFRTLSAGLRESDDIIECLICDKKLGTRLRLQRKNIGAHTKSDKHRDKLSGYIRARTLRAALGPESASTSADDSPAETQHDARARMKARVWPSCDGNGGGGSVAELPIIELWTPVSPREVTVPEEEEGDGFTDDGDSFVRDLESTNVISIQLPPQRSSGDLEVQMPDEDGEEEEQFEEPNVSLKAPSSSHNIPTATSPTYPWPSHAYIPQMFVTQLLFYGSARTRFSGAQQVAALEWAKSLGAPDVPTLHALKTVQKSIENMIQNPTEKVVSSSGTVFYINEVAQAIAKDFLNPITRLSMSEYPEDGGKSASELTNGSKWLLDLPRDLLTITARVRDKIYYVGELLQCRASDGRPGGFFIPDRFFTRTPAPKEGEPRIEELFALGYAVNKTTGGFVVIADARIVIPAETFLRTFRDLKQEGILDCGFADCSKSFEAHMPHPRREQAKGRMVYGVPLIIFMDDVSANISKQWNKHHAIYMSNGLLPRQMIEKEFCTRFVTSSPHATPMELVKGLKESIARAAKGGVEAYDCKYEEECLLVPHAHFWGSDNPMQAEECSHGGLSCNYFCRMCDVGGTQEEKRSDEGFLALFKAGTERTPEKTASLIHKQLKLSALHGATDKLQKHKATTGVSDSTSASAMQAIVDLGKAMYGHKHLETVGMSKEDIQAQLEQDVERVIEVHGINPVIGMPGVNIHKDTPTEILHTILLGVVKYFWGQTVHILEKSKGFTTFQTRLASIDESGLNIPKLSAEYICGYKGSLIGKHFKSLAQLMTFLIYDLVPRKVLDAWSIIGELVVLVWHTHIDDLEEYLDLTKHIVTGGYWKDPTSHRWVHAGDAVLYHMQESKVFRKLLALPDNSEGELSAGSAKLATAANSTEPNRASAIEWGATMASRASNADSLSFSSATSFLLASSLRAVEGDQTRLNDFVAFRIGKQLHVGRMKEILTTDREPSKAVVVSLEPLDFMDDPHELLRMPVLEPNNTINLQVVDPSDIICTLNVQHDCHYGECTNSKQQVVGQERLETSRSRPVVDHTDVQRFILNTHSLHNHSTISRLLPSFLATVLSRPSLPPHEQRALRLRAASHVRSQKDNSTSDGQTGDLELLPFEASARGGRGGRGRGRGRGRGCGGRDPPRHQDPGIPHDSGNNANRSQLELLKKDDLVARCRSQGLPVTGTKPVPIERLMEAAQKAPEQSQPAPARTNTTHHSEQGSQDGYGTGMMGGVEPTIQEEVQWGLDNRSVRHPGSENFDHDGDHIMQPITAPVSSGEERAQMKLDGLKRDRLVELCVLNSLPKSGTKPELVMRLRSKEAAQGFLLDSAEQS
ncbi:hypothetical protein V5O48_013001 [Marasmius crinis-equi]|uniref:SAP domain-containing protein n=1 Tax=Marasmius crinis-equi TaxID=585013 RepID=A0ABR3F1A6_9AGAR